jgi:hypothetical protein
MQVLWPLDCREIPVLAGPSKGTGPFGGKKFKTIRFHSASNMSVNIYNKRATSDPSSSCTMSVNIYSRRAHEPSALIFKSSSKPGRRLFGSSSRPDSVNSTASSSSSSSSSPIGIAFTAGRSAHASTPFEYSKPVTTTSLQERVELLQDSDNVLVSAENLLFLETQHKLAVSSLSKSFALSNLSILHIY